MRNKGRFLPGKHFDEGVQCCMGIKGKNQYELTLGAIEVKWVGGVGWGGGGH